MFNSVPNGSQNLNSCINQAFSYMALVSSLSVNQSIHQYYWSIPIVMNRSNNVKQ